MSAKNRKERKKKCLTFHTFFVIQRAKTENFSTLKNAEFSDNFNEFLITCLGFTNVIGNLRNN